MCTPRFGTVRDGERGREGREKAAARTPPSFFDWAPRRRGPLPTHPPSAIVEHCFPPWLAPNLITLIGLALLVGGYASLTATALDMSGTAPWWAHAAMGAATLSYLHLDCLDGKQARRTGTSSPLGQLFDHGCDALAVHALLIGVAATLDAGLLPRAVWGQLAVGGPWLMAHWEEYHSGVMLYGNRWWGVTEANYTLVVLHFISAAFGARRVWSAPLTNVLPASFASSHPHIVKLLSPYACNDALLACIYGCGVWQAATVLGRVFVLRTPRGLPAGEKGAKALGTGAQLSHLAQLTVFVGVGCAAMLEPLYAGRSAAHVRIVFGLYGIAYALEASKLIVDHMAKEPFGLVWWPVAIVAAVTANAAGGGPVDATVAAVAGFAVAALGYLHYVIAVVRQICDYLGIKCLTIPVRKVVVASPAINGGVTTRARSTRASARRGVA